MIDSKILIEAGIDYNAGMKRFLDNEEFYETVLDAFLSETMLERAQAAYDAGDYDKLERAVHEAKGAGGNAGLDLLYIEAGTLLELLHNGSYSQEELEKNFRDFSDTYLKIKTALSLALRNKEIGM